jgi:energy-coupling factor transport system substrate-specific component
VVLILVSLVGAMAFLWPFFIDPQVGLAHGRDAPWLFAALMSLLGLTLLAEQSSGRLDAKTVAVLGVLAALGGSLRVLSAGTAGLEPVFFLVVVAGRVLGRRLAFLAGALILLLGAFLTGGIGPWAPFQMIATGWVALGAALLPAWRGRREVLLLAAYGLVMGLGYGVVMNLWFWPFMGATAPSGAAFVAGGELAVNLTHYAVFYLTTSLAWDLPRGVLTCVLIVTAGRPVLAALRRAVRQASFEAVGRFE